MSALLSALLLFHRVLDLWFVLQEAVAISIRLVSLLHFVMKSNKKMVVTHAPLPLLPPPPIFSFEYLNEGIFPYFVSELSAGQVDVLWDCLVCDSESSDDTLEWFLQQAQSKEFHALDVSALQYILAEKVTPLI